MMRRGFMLLDVMVGIGIVAVLLLIMSVTLVRQQQAMAALADHRSATRAAEDALINLQEAGASAPADRNITARDVPGAAPSGYRWVEVEASAGKQRGALVGLVPKRAATQPGAPQP